MTIELCDTANVACHVSNGGVLLLLCANPVIMLLKWVMSETSVTDKLFLCNESCDPTLIFNVHEFKCYILMLES